MMKTSVIVVMLLLMVSIIVPANAQEFFTIQEIAQQAEAGWHQNYHAHGREISVDANITIPNVERFPIQKLEAAYIEPNLENIDSTIWDVKFQSEIRCFDISNKPLAENYPQRNMVDETTTSYLAPLDLHKAYAEASDVTLAETIEAVCKMLDYIGVDKGLFVLENPFLVQINNFFDKGTSDPIHPGIYSIRFRQQLNGIPVLMSSNFAFKKAHGNGLQPRLTASVYGDDLASVFRLAILRFKSIETVANDIPLCGFQTIIDSLEKEIADGHIRKVFDLELGYVLYDDPEHAQFPLGGYQFAFTVPAWRINCIYMDDANKEATDYTGLDESERASLEYATLVINAQTGEIENRHNTDECRSDYKGFISWEDIGGK